jgi:hypothetical protein
LVRTNYHVAAVLSFGVKGIFSDRCELNLQGKFESVLLENSSAFHFSHAKTSPLAAAMPLLMALSWPLSGSIIVLASRWEYFL